MKEGGTVAVTGQQVYRLALNLIDEVTNAGVVADSDPSNTTKAAAFLTTLQAEMLPAHVTPVLITNLSQNLLLTDRECLAVLPYGLAALLILQDNAGAASFFNSKFEELRSKKRAAITAITDIYNVTSGMR